MNRVLIVGAGPVGLLLAISLKQYNINVSIIDKIESRHEVLSKALSISSTSLKIFHGMDIIDDFLTHGIKLSRAEIFSNKRRIAFIEKKYLNSLYNFYLSIPQHETENILENKLKKHSTYVQYHQELIGLTPHKKSVQVTIKDLKANQIRTGCFNFVVGCDGAHSKVRELLKIPFIGKDYDIHFNLGDVRFEPHFSLSYPIYYADQDGFIMLYPMKNGNIRVIAQSRGKLLNVSKKLTTEDIQMYLDNYLPERRIVSDLTWSSKVQIVHRMSPLLRDGCVFLAGDACHVFSPIGGQTMNTGFQDAFNLGWKLGHYLNNLAKIQLLDSYQQHRTLAAKKVFKSTDLYTRVLSQSDTRQDELKHFQLNFKSRKHYKNNLISEFAGYKADHSTDMKSLVGTHVPYIEFQFSYFNLKSTYDLPRLKKLILVTLDCCVYLLNRTLASYSEILIEMRITKAEYGLIDKLQVDNDTLCLICPDGYIAAHGNFAKIIKYLKQYY